ncbi:MotA/TolQ/ExbB proton channel family protein [Myxococcota bacterium]|nr:MotA/TolQ/ExbB proton channel family protein [Myxococcota bacterium]
MHATLDTLRGLWIAGGDVMLPLVIVGGLLWWTLGERWSRTRGGPSLPLRQLVERARRGESVPGDGPVQRALLLGVAALAQGQDALDETLTQRFSALRDELGQGASLCATLVGVAPLLGLLGTVSGMITTFDALATMTMFSRSGGIAGGISEALVSTQVGLTVAIPGAIAAKLMDQRAARRREQLDELEQILRGLAEEAR